MRLMDNVDLTEHERKQVEPSDEDLAEDLDADITEAQASKEGLIQQDFIFPLFNPIGRAFGEVALYEFEGAGIAEIQFQQDFSGTPIFIASTFGVWEVRFPTGFDWRYIDLGLTSTFVPNGINWDTLRLPNPCFQISADKNKAKFVNGFGRSYVAYMALEI